MARKNLLASVAAKGANRNSLEERAAYVRHGASRSLMASIEEMAESAKRLTEGESIVLLSPADIDGSFVADRMESDEDGFRELKEAIRAQGQATPILVRPHPQVANRFMVVFGHRRLRAARELGIDVRAVVKDMAEIAHVVAQGQENSARTNLSFIEKSVFASKLHRMGHAKATIMTALSIDDTLLSRMLSVAELVPQAVIDAIGPARGVGRDRWEELKKRLAVPANRSAAIEAAQQPGLQDLPSGERFKKVLAALHQSRRPRDGAPQQPRNLWQAPDQSLSARFNPSGRSFNVTLTAAGAAEFGQFLMSNFDRLFEAFQATRTRNQQAERQQKKKAP